MMHAVLSGGPLDGVELDIEGLVVDEDGLVMVIPPKGTLTSGNILVKLDQDLRRTQFYERYEYEGLDRLSGELILVHKGSYGEDPGQDDVALLYGEDL